ncbi:MAG: WD40/YVTN/BNR-like repeat-containing protein [Gammaproteobacteria bacterium]
MNTRALTRTVSLSLKHALIVAGALIAMGQTADAHTPHDVISEIEVSPSFEQDGTLFTIVRDNLCRSLDGGRTWKRLVNGLDSPSIYSSLSVSVHSAHHLFLSTLGNGIYGSTDRGASWAKVNNGLSTLRIAIVVMSSDPSNQVAWASANGTGKVFRTVNGGASWSTVKSGSSPFTAIAVSKTNSDFVLIGDGSGVLYASEDGGTTWREIRRFRNAPISAIGVSPHYPEDGAFFVGTRTQGIFKTSDGGDSFVAANTGIGDLDITQIVASPAYATDGTVYASAWRSAIYRSENAGLSWAKRSQGITIGLQAILLPQFADLAISEGGALFLAGFDGLFSSSNSGATWGQLDTLSRRIIVSIAVSPIHDVDATIVFGSYLAGIFKSVNEGISWDVLRPYPNPIRVADIAFSPAFGSDRTIFVTKAQMHIEKSPDAGRTWQHKLINRNVTPTFIAISPAYGSDQTVFVGSRQGQVYRSRNGGNSFVQVWNLATSRQTQSLVISPNFATDQTLFISYGGGVYRTVNAGASWQLVDSRSEFNNFVNLAVTPSFATDRTVFAGTDRGLYKSQDRGVTWAKAASTSTDVNGGYIETIAVSPDYRNDRTILLSLRGKGLYRSADDGTSFSKIGPALIRNNHGLGPWISFPLGSISIKFSPRYSEDRTVYGTSGERLFRSTNNGLTWSIVGLPDM